MKIEYVLNQGFKIASMRFNWGEERNAVREKLQNLHRQDDKVNDMNEDLGGENNYYMEERSDIYENLHSTGSYFCLYYDSKEQLSELAIHAGYDVQVETVSMAWGEDITPYIEALGQLNGGVVLKLGEGDYIFKKLQCTLANAASLGDEGNTLAYFYAAKVLDDLG